LVAILVFSVILFCLFVNFHLFSGVGTHRNYFRSDLVPHNSSTPPVVRPFVGRGATGFPIGLVGVLMGSCGYHYGMQF
jgi:hypothetical protein